MKNRNLENLKTEAASELGVKFTAYNGDLSSKQCGSVGGAMIKKIVSQYEGRK